MNHENEKQFSALTEEAVVIGMRTTGSDPGQDRIIEAAALVVDLTAMEQEDQLEIRYFTRRVNPERPIPKKIASAGGISDRKVKNEPPFREIAGQLREYIGDRPLIGHDAAFQKELLNAEFERAGRKGLRANPVYCTKEHVGRYLDALDGQVGDLSLGRVLRWFAIIDDTGKLEGAFEDAYLTLKLAIALRAIDDLPGSAGERWEHYFDNFPALDTTEGTKKYTPRTGEISRMSDFGGKVKLVLKRTAKFFALFMIGFFLAALVLRIL